MTSKDAADVAPSQIRSLNSRSKNREVAASQSTTKMDQKSAPAEALKEGERSVASLNSKGTVGSNGTSLSISIDELKRLVLQRETSADSSCTTPKTSSLTIGNSSTLSGSRSAATPQSNNRNSETKADHIMPDLFFLEQAFSECEDEELKEGLEKLLSRQKKGNHTEASRGNMPIAWKTPFEVDAPRETLRSLHRPSSPSVRQAPDPMMTEEQNAWAGIDELLEDGSLDGSNVSTEEVLPGSIVRAMNRETSSSNVMEDDGKEVDEDEDQPGELANIMKGQRQPRRASTGGSGGTLFDMFHWSEKDNVDEMRRQKKKLNNKHNRVKVSKITFSDEQHQNPVQNREKVSKITFSDEQNQNPVQNRAKVSKITFSDEQNQNSLPSLASIQDEDVESRADGLDVDSSGAPPADAKSRATTITNGWESFGGGFDRGAQETANRGDVDVVKMTKEDAQFFGSKPTFNDDGFGTMKNCESNAAPAVDQNFKFDEDVWGGTQKVGLGKDGMALNEDVDQYIRGVQEILTSPQPEKAKAGKKKKKKAKAVDDASIVSAEQSLVEELPSLSSFSSASQEGQNREKKHSGRQKGAGRKGDEKNMKLSVSSSLKNSLKKMATIGLSPKGSFSGRSEEKYFPDDSKRNQKRFSSNRCLLNEADDDGNFN